MTLAWITATARGKTSFSKPKIDEALSRINRRQTRLEMRLEMTFKYRHRGAAIGAEKMISSRYSCQLFARIAPKNSTRSKLSAMSYHF